MDDRLLTHTHKGRHSEKKITLTYRIHEKIVSLQKQHNLDNGENFDMLDFFIFKLLSSFILIVHALYYEFF